MTLLFECGVEHLAIDSDASTIVTLLLHHAATAFAAASFFAAIG